MARKQPIRPCGLANVGNMCYVNAALQCLFSSARFTDAFSDLSTEKVHSPLLRAIQELLNRMKVEGYADAHKLKETLGVAVERFSGFSQQDSQEFLAVLLENIHKDLTTDLHQQTSVVTECFQGKHQSILTCQSCNKTTERQDPFMFLFVPMNDSRAMLDVNSLFMDEQCIDSWSCPDCNGKERRDGENRVTRKMEVCTMPPIMMLYLKRFHHNNGGGYKLDTFITFPTELQVVRSGLRYTLFAVINHHGTISSGHYNAFSKRGGIWYTCNDSIITECPELDVVVSDYTKTKDAYVLFYELLEQPADKSVIEKSQSCQPDEQHSDEGEGGHISLTKDDSNETNYQSFELPETESEGNNSSAKEITSPLGFRNYSNNNYLNPALQCLKITQPLVKYLRSAIDSGLRDMELLEHVFGTCDEDTLKKSIESLVVRFYANDPREVIIMVLHQLHQKTDVSEAISVCSIPNDAENPYLTECQMLAIGESRQIIKSQIVIILSSQDLSQFTRKQNGSNLPIISAKMTSGSSMDSDGIPMYSLYGVVQHMDGMYYSVCKIKGDWYEFRDDIVSPSHDIYEHVRNAYALFYQSNISSYN